MASFIRRLPFLSSGAASSVPVTPEPPQPAPVASEKKTTAKLFFPDGPQTANSGILEENLATLLKDIFPDGDMKKLALAVHEPIDQQRFSKTFSGLSFTFRIEREKEGEVTLYIYGRDLLGKGGFKKVKNAIKITVRSDNTCIASDFVVQRILKKRNEDLKIIEDSFNRIQAFEAAHHSSGAPERFKVGPSARPMPYTSKHGESRLEIVQPRIESSIYKSDSLTAEEKLKALIDAADGISQIHRQGYIHDDVKADNILVSYKKDDNSREGYIGDVDLLKKEGTVKIRKKIKDYFARDYLAVNGVYTKNTDLYGLSVAAVQAFLPKFFFTVNPGECFKGKLHASFETHSLEKILFWSLDNENPPREAFIAFKNSGKKHKKNIFKSFFKNSEEKYKNIHESFPVEFRILGIFKREFLLSLKYNDQVMEELDKQKKKTKKDKTSLQAAMSEPIQKIAQDLNLSTIDSLKNEFIELLSSLEGRSPAASGVSEPS